MWYNTYIDKSDKKENFFSQYGSYMHLILEMFSKQQLDFPELVPYFEENYDKFVTEYKKKKKMEIEVVYEKQNNNYIISSFSQ